MSEVGEELRVLVARAIGDVSMLAAADRVLALLAPYLRPETMTAEKLNEIARRHVATDSGALAGREAEDRFLLRGWAREIGTP